MRGKIRAREESSSFVSNLGKVVNGSGIDLCERLQINLDSELSDQLGRTRNMSTLFLIAFQGRLS